MLVHESVEDLDAIVPEWSQLAERSGNLFATPEWMLLWWRHFGAGRELRVTACRDGNGNLVGLLPLYVWRSRPLRILRFLGHGPGDELGPICAPEDRSVVAAELARALEAERYDVLLGDLLPGAGTWSSVLPGAAVLGREASPVLTFDDGGWDGFLASRSRNLREQVRRRERALGRDRDLQFRLTDAATLADDLGTLFRLHAERWHGSPSGFNVHEAFHREFAGTAAARGWLRLRVLELDGRPAAAWLGFRFAGAEHYYQAGRDPKLDDLSVGFVLLVHTIRAAAEEGAREYRFLRGGESFKFRFATSDPGVETIGLARGPLGRAALAAARRYVAVRRSFRSRRAASASAAMPSTRTT